LNEAAAESPIRVYLMIENRLLREALGRLFHKRPDLQVVGQSDHSSSPAQELLDEQCDILALDFFNPKCLPSFFSLDSPPSCRFKTVLIGMGDDSALFLRAVRAGVSGYLLKDASASDVVAAIRSTFKGEAVCPPKLCAALFEFFAQNQREGQLRNMPRRADLTLRQRQLVNLVAKGLTNKEIAAQLNLSEFTVRNHIHRIMKQVDVGSRREAVRVVQDQELAVNA
jgi:two-component system, NarL family, nitrate/nitrite response regulator NarL